MLDWKTAAENDSMYNTPPCWTIYICGLVFARMLREGGLTAALANNEKASWALGVWGAGGGVSLKCGLGLLPSNEKASLALGPAGGWGGGGGDGELE